MGNVHLQLNPGHYSCGEQLLDVICILSDSSDNFVFIPESET